MRVRPLLVAVAALLGALSLLAGPVAPAAAWADSYPPAGVQVVTGRVSPSTVPSGGSVTFSGAGFLPGARLQVSLDGAQVATVAATSTGAFELVIPVRGAGTRALAAAGLEPGARLRVVSASVTLSGGLPQTGFGHTVASLLLGLFLVVAGAGLVLAARTRGHRRALVRLQAG